ncbi:Predicted DNA binding protein, contains HTH domain [Haladaptatus litoreus]|uniref:Predicted DNA binding protein, contains HTH domain n=1 Tax=Haladaptatus litoreus TaxID=553468 RepID=A0A1N7EHZ6_9EURY|nr:helix-turn-helix domain-containing protein [Haladaptatus litoreus]SIR87629.1 Predicted DNA binding protein, contains HTH domain [Haladaptatus litoreus]
MAHAGEDTGRIDPHSSQLTLRIWHPNCWTLQTTAATDAGLIAHGVYHTGGVTNARCTAYADSRKQINSLIDEIKSSPLTTEIQRVQEYFNLRARGNAAAGNTTEELLVKYESCNSIHDAFIKRGFIPEEEIRVHDGREYWTVIITQDRAEISRRLDEIRSEMNAEITIEGMKSPDTHTQNSSPAVELSERQREVFELAQRRGYYSWPRETSASELADEIDISKTTLLEHLRKAEVKLLGSV